MEKTLNTLEKFVLYAVVLLIPLFIVPIFSNPYDVPKLTLLALGITLIILIEVWKMLTTNKLKFSLGSFDLPVLIFAFAYLASAVVATPNKMEAFFLPGTTMVILTGTLLYFALNMVFGDSKKGLITSLLISGVALSTLSLFSVTGILGKVSQLPDFMKATTFSFAGGQLATVIFLAIIAPLAIGMIITESEIVKKLFWAVSFLIIALGLGLSINFLLPGKENNLVLPSFPTSWAIAVEALKQSPIVGVGAGNYLSAFGQFRPLVYNLSPLWSVRFPFGSDFFLTLLAETGLLGLAGYILILVKGGTLIRDRLDGHPWPYLALGMVLLATLVVPANLVFLVTLFVILALVSNVKEKEMVVSPALLVILPVLVGLGAFWFFSTRALVAEAIFARGVASLTKNDAKGTYDSLRSAINQNPYVDRYHAAFAQVNLAIAKSLADKKELKDEDKNNITSAIQAAIAEGKATVVLNPQRATSWSLLANIYQAVMPFAQGADTFTIQAYSQAISLDPTDPNLRITLGGVYYALGRYDDAIETFRLATLAKPDFANGHYNLSAAYREKGEIANAINEMKIVLTLVPKNGNDYTTAQTELDSLEKKSAASKTSTSGQAGELTTPAKAPAPAINPQISLPSEATPPAQP